MHLIAPYRTAWAVNGGSSWQRTSAVNLLPTVSIKGIFSVCIKAMFLYRELTYIYHTMHGMESFLQLRLLLLSALVWKVGEVGGKPKAVFFYSSKQKLVKGPTTKRPWKPWCCCLDPKIYWRSTLWGETIWAKGSCQGSEGRAGVGMSLGLG